MSDPCGCDESKFLRSELEVARMRLDDGIKVMNARQANDRASIRAAKVVGAELRLLLSALPVERYEQACALLNRIEAL